jgi:hypothetical protein
MEMTFDNPSESSLRANKSVRSRIPSPYDGSQTDSETQTVVSAKDSRKKSAFLSNLFGRKSFSAGKSATSPTAVTPADSGTLPRSSRSMPPSPFSSLKRPSKSSKSRRTTTAGPIAQSHSRGSQLGRQVYETPESVSDSGVNFEDSGVNIKDSGVNFKDSGVNF